MFAGFSHSVKGESHTASGLVCQDYSAHEVHEHYAIAAIADGHGSKKHFRSHKGSQFAVEAALETVKRFYMDPERFEENFPKNHKMIMKNMAKQIISNWNVRVFEHLKRNPVERAERIKFDKAEFDQIPQESYYGTTLVIAVAGRGFTFGLQIGDGSLVALFDDCEAVMPMVYDESAPANVTASMCNSNAAQFFNSFFISDKKLIAIYTSSDGLYTSFGSEYDFLDYHTIITSQLTNMEAFEAAVKKNIEKRSHFGTQDDISLACVCDVDMVKQNAQRLKEKVAENKQRAAERKAARLKVQL